MAEHQERTPTAPPRRRRWLMSLVLVGVFGFGILTGLALADRDDRSTMWMDQRMANGPMMAKYDTTRGMWPHTTTDWDDWDHQMNGWMNGPMMRGG